MKAGAYGRFLKENASRVNSIESALRSLTWLLPGQFKDSLIVSEGAYAALKLLGFFHDSIILSQSCCQPDNDSLYAQRIQSINCSTSFACYTLTCIKTLESIGEMIIMQKSGSKDATQKYDYIVAVEVIKSLLKTYVWLQTGYRMIPSHLIPRTDRTLLENQYDSNISPYIGPHTQKFFPTLADIKRVGGVRSFIESKAGEKQMSFQSCSDLSSLIGPNSSLIDKIAELAFIFRPVIYALLLKRDGRNSWRPWIVSLLIELAAQLKYLNHLFFTSRRNNSKQGYYSWYEAEERLKRFILLLMYFMRAPMYGLFTKPKMDGIAEWMKDRRFIGWIGKIVKSYQSLWENVYFYTSAS